MKFKKGKYYVGDPCYIFENSWMDVLNSTHFFDPSNGGFHEIYGKQCAGGGTSYGDGTYYDTVSERHYWVDSGMLSIMPVSLLKIDNKTNLEEIEKCEGMHIINFKEDFEVLIHDGKFQFGDILIDTRNDNDEEE